MALGQLSEYEFMLGADSLSATDQRKLVGRALFAPESSMQDFTHCIEILTTALVRNSNRKLRHIYELDAVKDIATLSWTQFAARLFHIPLKDTRDADATLDDRKLYDLLKATFEFTFFDTDPARSFARQKNGLNAYKELLNVIKPACDAVKRRSKTHPFSFPALASSHQKLLPHHGTQLLERLLGSGNSVDEVASWVISLIGGLVIPSAKAVGCSPPCFPAH
jgi:hypothetical protein